MLRWLSRGTTQRLYFVDPVLGEHGHPVLDDRGKPRAEHYLLMPLVTHFLGSKEPDQLCVKRCFWAEDPNGEVIPTDLDEGWAGITASETLALYEAARELGAVTLVYVEDVQRTDQGDIYVPAAAFLCELGGEGGVLFREGGKVPAHSSRSRFE